MGKKKFFQRREPDEILELNSKVVGTPKDLVSRIEEVSAKEDALLLDFKLEHPDYQDSQDSLYNARRTMRGVKVARDGRKTYPSYLQLAQPRSKEQARTAYGRGWFPFRLRNMALHEMKKIPEEKNFNVGYMVWPISGSDRSPVLYSFWSIMQGTILDAYSGRVCRKLPKEFLNAGAFVERDYSPELIVKVPSTTKGKKQYTQRWSDVPTAKNPRDGRAIIGWNTKPAYGTIVEDSFVADEGESPEHKQTNFSHEGKKGYGGSVKLNVIYPHCMAGHQELVRAFMRQGDLSPLEMSQFAIPSREDMVFYNKLRNNILIRGENSEEITGRPLRINELSTLMARRVANKIRRLDKVGDIQKTMFWDPERDGKISDYPCLPGEE